MAAAHPFMAIFQLTKALSIIYSFYNLLLNLLNASELLLHSSLQEKWP